MIAPIHTWMPVLSPVVGEEVALIKLAVTFLLSVIGGIVAGFCYCPAPGYCACIMIPHGIEEYINSEYDLEASIKIHKDPLR